MLHSVLFDMQHDPILKKLILLSNTSLNLSEFEDESILSALINSNEILPLQKLS